MLADLEVTNRAHLREKAAAQVRLLVKVPSYAVLAAPSGRSSYTQLLLKQEVPALVSYWRLCSLWLGARRAFMRRSLLRSDHP